MNTLVLLALLTSTMASLYPLLPTCPVQLLLESILRPIAGCGRCLTRRPTALVNDWHLLGIIRPIAARHRVLKQENTRLVRPLLRGHSLAKLLHLGLSRSTGLFNVLVVLGRVEVTLVVLTRQWKVPCVRLLESSELALPPQVSSIPLAAVFLPMARLLPLPKLAVAEVEIGVVTLRSLLARVPSSVLVLEHRTNLMIPSVVPALRQALSCVSPRERLGRKLVMANGLEFTVPCRQLVSDDLELQITLSSLDSVCSSAGPGPVSATIIAAVPGPVIDVRLFNLLMLVIPPAMPRRNDYMVLEVLNARLPEKAMFDRSARAMASLLLEAP